MYHKDLRTFRGKVNEELKANRFHDLLGFNEVEFLKVVQMGLKEMLRYRSLKEVNSIIHNSNKSKDAVGVLKGGISLFLFVISYALLLVFLGFKFPWKKVKKNNSLKLFFRPKMQRHFKKLGDDYDEGQKHFILGFSDIKAGGGKDVAEDIQVFFPGKFGLKPFFKGLKVALNFHSKLCKANHLQGFSKKEIIIFSKILIRIIFSNKLSESYIAKYFNSGDTLLLENDFGIPHISIAVQAKKEGVKAVHVQHGVFFKDNLEYTPPVANYMICCSDRDKIELSRFIDKDKVFPISIPLQMFSLPQLPITNPDYDFLILGKAGILWHTEYVYRSIHNTKNLFKDKKVLLRHHPGADNANRAHLEELVDSFEVSKNVKLEDDIQLSEIIISFSMDALIPILHNYRKVIYCVEEEMPNIYNDLDLFVPNFRVARNKEELNDAINYLCKLDVDFSIDKEKYLTALKYNFGESIYDTSLKNFKAAVNNIISN